MKQGEIWTKESIFTVKRERKIFKQRFIHCQLHGDFDLVMTSEKAFEKEHSNCKPDVPSTAKKSHLEKEQIKKFL